MKGGNWIKGGTPLLGQPDVGKARVGDDRYY